MKLRISILSTIMFMNVAYGLPDIHRLLAAMQNNAAMTAFLKNIITPGNLVFDVGANIGKKADLYLACGAKVICVEPQPECIQHLEKHFKNNAAIVIERTGLADKDGVLELFQCSAANTISTFSSEWVNDSRFTGGYVWDKKIQVPVTTLDTLIKKHGVPQFCKIDVENFEYEVLKGLTYRIPYISFEFAVEVLDNSKKCIEYLTSLGYKKFNVVIGESSEYFCSDWLSAQEMIALLYSYEESRTWKSPVWGDIYALYEVNQ